MTRSVKELIRQYETNRSRTTLPFLAADISSDANKIVLPTLTKAQEDFLARHDDMLDSGESSMVDLSEMFVDYSYQTNLNPSKVAERANNWNGRLVNVLTLSRREDGKYAIVDGQHRFAAALLRGLKQLRCIIYDDMSVRDEAWLFVKLNSRHNRRAPSNKSEWNAEIVSESNTGKLNHAIDAILVEVGYKRVGQEGKPRVDSVDLLRQCYRLDDTGEALKSALYATKRAWPGQSVTGIMLRAVTEMFHQISDLHTAHLSKTLGGFAQSGTGFDTWIFKVRAAFGQKPTSVGMPWVFVKVISKAYNVSRRGRKTIKPIDIHLAVGDLPEPGAKTAKKDTGRATSRKRTNGSAHAAH